MGTGFIIDKEGLILTNNHAVEDTTELKVKLSDNREFNATIVGRDPKTDVALIRITADGPLTQLPLGDSDALEVGDWVVAIGNPFGLGNTVTSGIVSAKYRQIGAGAYDNFLFGTILLAWIGINSAVLLWKPPFDPYPFILLNLVLSCLAAVQAPVIMMSQNRQEAKDRFRAEYDYQINLKAELEIRHLHEKIDHLLSRQWERLVEIQQIQMELMTELAEHSSANG